MHAVRRLIADRRSAPARGFYEAVARVAGARTHDEAVVAAALVELMGGGLAAFRGSTLPELVDLIQTTVDRITGGAPDVATDASLVSLLDGALHAPVGDRSRARTVTQLRSVRTALERNAIPFGEAIGERRPTSSSV